MSYRPAIYHNILLSAQSIIETMQAIGVDFERPENKVFSTSHPSPPFTQGLFIARTTQTQSWHIR